MAIVFHTEQSRNVRLITAHEIISHNHKPVLTAGRAFNRADEQELLTLLMRGKRTGTGVLPPGLLWHSDAGFAWVIPASTRKMHLCDDQGKHKAVTVRWPSLVAAVFYGKLHLAAFVPGKDAFAPTEDAPMFHAPLGNIYANSSVCLGNAKAPTDADLGAIPAWNAIINDSAFTHDNHDRVLPRAKAGRNNAYAFWLKRHGNKTDLRASEMVPLRATLGTWLQDLENNDA